ncbi:MAG: SAM-dependent methyltransferase [Chloroflexota bacterium]
MKLIEADKRLSQSLLWKIQRSYFESAGMRAWQDDIVPHTISCNPFMARAYANLIQGYLRDMTAQIDPAEPLYIVELGAGSGRLTHHLIHQLQPLLNNAFNLKFVLTDFTDSVIEHWRSHPQLMLLAEEGLLDFALFDVMNMRPLELLHSGRTLSPQSNNNPVILLANYFFDSIPQDSFVIENGELHSNLLSLYAGSDEEFVITNPNLWDSLSLAYEPLPSDGTPYETELYNQILADYEQLPDTSLSFPNIGLDCLQFWMTYGDVLLLTADRGTSHAEALIGQEDPLPNLHGSFSMMVNYHAMSEFVERSGGRVFVPPHYQDNVQTLAYVMQKEDRAWHATQQAFEQSILQNNPDDFFSLRYYLLKQIPEMTIDQFMSLMRWSAYDGDILRLGLDRLVELVASEPAWADDVADMLWRVKRQYLVIRPDDDLINRIDNLLMEDFGSLFD